MKELENLEKEDISFLEEYMEILQIKRTFS